MLDLMFEMFSKKFGKLLIIIVISKNEILVLKIVYLINKNRIYYSWIINSEKDIVLEMYLMR